MPNPPPRENEMWYTNICLRITTYIRINRRWMLQSRDIVTDTIATVVELEWRGKNMTWLKYALFASNVRNQIITSFFNPLVRTSKMLVCH
jgi:ABC-type phosphate/phosphonate transport system permease subunit